MKGQFKPDGYFTISNCFSIEIKINEAADAITYKFSNDNTLYETEIVYLENEENEELEAAFITRSGMEIFLSECMRC